MGRESRRPAMSRCRPGAWPAQHTVEDGLLSVTIVVIVLLGLVAFGHLIEPWFAARTGRITTSGS